MKNASEGLHFSESNTDNFEQNHLCLRKKIIHDQSNILNIKLTYFYNF